MGAYIVRRLWQMVPTMLGVVLLVFFLFNWVGGDPAYVLAGKISNQEQIDNIRRQLGVDQPYWVQLGIFLKQILTADFGASWSTNERVSHILMTRLGPSLTVLVPLLFLTTLISIGLALAVAYVRGSFTDRMVMIVCTVGLSISILVYIIVFQYVFAYKLGWFPVQGWGDSFVENLFVYAALPILIALVVSIAPNLRLYRTFVLDEINQDYVRTARAKGVSENRIMWIHVLRNASIPIITFLMAELPGLLLGSFLIERFFSIPGIGREVILAVSDPRGRALGLSGDQGDHRVRGVRDDRHQPARGSDLQGSRPARAAQVTGAQDGHRPCRATRPRAAARPRDPAHRVARPVGAGLAPPQVRPGRDGVARHRRRVHRHDDPVRHGIDRKRLEPRGRHQLCAAFVR
jgi:peptide/nickel transport system permease protein